LTNENTYLKAGTNVYRYGTHFPYTDGTNNISGATILIGGKVNIKIGLLTCSNGLTLSSGTLTLPKIVLVILPYHQIYQN
jgi:hypothetical protein